MTQDLAGRVFLATGATDGIGKAAAMAFAKRGAALLAAPPYFGADAASAGLRHVSMGHRLRWAPPSADDVCLALLARAQPDPLAPALVCPPAGSRRADMVARVNTVRLAGEAAALLAAGLAGTWLRRSATGRWDAGNG